MKTHLTPRFLPTIVRSILIGAALALLYTGCTDKTEENPSTLRRDVNRLVDQLDSADLSDPTALALDTAATMRGERGMVESLVRKMLNRIITLRADYMKDITAIGWDSVLAPERVIRDKSLAESKRMIASARSLIATYRGRTHSILDTLGMEIGALDIDEETRASMASGYTSALKEREGELDRQWDLEAQVVDEVDAIITILGTKRGRWKVSDEGVMFTDPDALASYNSHLTRLQGIVQQQEQVAREGREQINRGLSKIEGN